MQCTPGRGPGRTAKSNERVVMPWGALTEAREFWGFLGALAGAAFVFLLGLLNIGTKDRAALTKDQLALIEMLRKEVESMHARLADMDLALRNERQSCDERMSAIEQRHQKKMAELEARLSRTEAEDQEK